MKVIKEFLSLKCKEIPQYWKRYIWWCICLITGMLCANYNFGEKYFEWFWGTIAGNITMGLMYLYVLIVFIIWLKSNWKQAKENVKKSKQ